MASTGGSAPIRRCHTPGAAGASHPEPSRHRPRFVVAVGVRRWHAPKNKRQDEARRQRRRRGCGGREQTVTIPRLKSHPSSPWGAHIWFRSHSMVTVVPIEATKGELWTSAERAYPFFLCLRARPRQGAEWGQGGFRRESNDGHLIASLA